MLWESREGMNIELGEERGGIEQSLKIGTGILFVWHK